MIAAATYLDFLYALRVVAILFTFACMLMWPALTMAQGRPRSTMIALVALEFFMLSCIATVVDSWNIHHLIWYRSPLIAAAGSFGVAYILVSMKVLKDRR